MQCATYGRSAARTHFVETLGVQELRNSHGVQLTSGNAQAAGSSFRLTEKLVGSETAVFMPSA
jgi:hypothetical protein